MFKYLQIMGMVLIIALSFGVKSLYFKTVNQQIEISELKKEMDKMNETNVKLFKLLDTYQLELEALNEKNNAIEDSIEEPDADLLNIYNCIMDPTCLGK